MRKCLSHSVFLLKGHFVYLIYSLCYIESDPFFFFVIYFASVWGVFFQAYYRRASAKMALGKFKEALKDFEYVSHLPVKIALNINLCYNIL